MDNGSIILFVHSFIILKMKKCSVLRESSIQTSRLVNRRLTYYIGRFIVECGRKVLRMVTGKSSKPKKKSTSKKKPVEKRTSKTGSSIPKRVFSQEEEISEFVDTLKSDYPDLKFKIIDNKWIDVSNWDVDKKRVARFWCTKSADFLLQEFEGMDRIKISSDKAVVIKENNVIGIIDVANQSARLRFDGIRPDKFNIRFKGRVFEVEFNHYRGIQIFLRNEFPEMTFISFRKLYRDLDMPKYGGWKEEDLWNFIRYSLLLGVVDGREWRRTRPPGSLDIKKIGWFERIPTLTYYHTRSIFKLQSEKGDDKAKELLHEYWEDIYNSAMFEFYKIHGTIANVFDLVPMRKTPEKETRTRSRPKKVQVEDCGLRRIPADLFQYMIAAESTSLVTFRFLSYYHLLERFFDEVVYTDLYDEIHQILKGSDVSYKPKEYADILTNMITEYSLPKNMRDEEKLEQLLIKYIPFQARNVLIPAEIKKIMKKTIKFKGGLVLLDIDWTKKIKFHSRLANRISRLRNTIVHANPGIIQKRGGVKFSPRDLTSIAQEAAMVRFFALEIISRSSPLEP